MIESQLEMVKNSEWDDLLRPTEEETLNIPTLKEILSSVNQAETQSTATDTEPSNEVNDESSEVVKVVSTDGTEDNNDAQESSIEGTLPAIELPK